jgi:Ca-activated chloride channel family protein
VDRLFEAIDSPVLVDVRIDWNGLPVRDVYPQQLRDLFAGQTLAVLGRYTAPARGTAWVHARVGTRHLRYPVAVDLPADRPENAALAPTWARYKIADLSAAMLTAQGDDQQTLQREITDLAVQYRLVSQFTSFVAVDESRIVGDGRPLRILQPVELPEGVSYEGIFGERAVGRPVRVGAWGVTLQETESGRVRVGAVAAGSAAARAGVRAGAALLTANRAAIKSLTTLATVLAQSAGPTVRVRLEPGGDAVLPVP